MDFINRLREKSVSTKRIFAVGTSAVVTLAIFGLWMTVFHFGSGASSGNATASVANASSTEDVNPLSAFWATISSGWNGLSDSISQTKNGVSGAVNTSGSLGSTTTPTATEETTGQTPSSNSSPAANPVAQPVPQSTSQPSSHDDVFILSGTPTDNH